MAIRVLRLSAENVAGLLAQPESGMGFQLVSTTVRFGSGSEFWIVLNAELAIAFDQNTDPTTWLRVRSVVAVEELRAQAADESSLYTPPQVVVTRSGFAFTSHYTGGARGLAPAPHSLVKLALAPGGTRYVRFSAFLNDRRIDPVTGNFLPGTYAATAVDAPLAPSGFAAVGRYALPNVSPASYAHAITARGGELIQSGTVAPAYGQAGGGVEVYFPRGAVNSAGRLTSKVLPDE